MIPPDGVRDIGVETNPEPEVVEISKSAGGVIITVAIKFEPLTLNVC